MKSTPIKIGDWVVDPLAGEISSSDGKQHLEPKVMQVLTYLAAHPGDVLTRDEILNAVWGPQAVSDEPLTRCIKDLRKVLRDSPTDAQYIRTIPKIGYMMVADVCDADPPEQAFATIGRDTHVSQSRPESRNIHKSRFVTHWAVFMSVIAAVLIGIAIMFLKKDGSEDIDTARGTASIAVLPFENSRLASSENYLGAGLAEEVRLILGQIPEFKVVAGQSSSIFAESKDDVRSIASELGVEYVLDGTIQTEGSEILVFVKLNSGASGFQLWSEKFRFRASGVFEIQTQIANSAVDALVKTLALPSTTPRFDIRKPTQNIEAFDLFLRGRHFLNLRDHENLRNAIGMFDSAIESDPSYGMPYVAMAYAMSLLPGNTKEEQDRAYQQARNTLRTAVDMDPSVAQASDGIEAYIDLREWRLVSAYTRYRRSLARFPNEPILHHGYSLLMSTVGRSDEALEHAIIAHDLDTLSPIANSRLAVAYLWVGNNEKAAEYFNKTADLGLNTPLNIQAYLILLLRTEQFEKARVVGAQLQATLGLDAAWWNAFVTAIEDEEMHHAALESVESAAQSGQIVPIMQFGVWAVLGEHDKAIDVAEYLLIARSAFVGGVLFAEDFANVRRNPRFAELLRSTAIPRFWRQFGWSEYCSESSNGDIDCT